MTAAAVFGNEADEFFDALPALPIGPVPENAVLVRCFFQPGVRNGLEAERKHRHGRIQGERQSPRGNPAEAF